MIDVPAQPANMKTQHILQAPVEIVAKWAYADFMSQLSRGGGGLFVGACDPPLDPSERGGPVL